jgi:hypothetical protein
VATVHHVRKCLLPRLVALGLPRIARQRRKRGARRGGLSQGRPR